MGFVLQSLSAALFFGSALFWWRAATFPHPEHIDLGEIGSNEEPKDWFWAYRQVSKLNSYAAWLAGAGAILSGFAMLFPST